MDRWIDPYNRGAQLNFQAYSQLQFSGCSTQQSHSILEEKQVRRITFIHHHRLGGINAHRDHVCRSLSRLNDFSIISLGSLLSGTQAPCKFTAVMVDDVVDAICLWLGFCCELNLVVRSMDEYGWIMGSYLVDVDCRYFKLIYFGCSGWLRLDALCDETKILTNSEIFFRPNILILRLILFL